MDSASVVTTPLVRATAMSVLLMTKYKDSDLNFTEICMNTYKRNYTYLFHFP
jgi:hypothetical protein